MFKKLICTILVGVSVCVFTGCGTSTPKLEDKTEKADYAKMQNNQFNAKYTYLENVTSNREVKSDLFPDKKALEVCEEGSGGDLWYTIVITDCDKNSEVKSRLGTTLNRDKMNISKAEVVPQSLGNNKVKPTLLVKQSDIELIREIKFEEMLKSNETFKEMNKGESSLSLYLSDARDGKLNYDKEKYSQRVKELLKDYEEWSSELHQQQDKVKKKDDYADIEFSHTKINVELDVEPVISDNKVIFNIKTNLPDQTIIMVQLRNDKINYFAQDSVSVSGGKAQTAQFSRREMPLPDGSYELSIGTPFYIIQPNSVKAQIGDKGSNLTGPCISNDSEMGKTANLDKIIKIGSN